MDDKRRETGCSSSIIRHSAFIVSVQPVQRLAEGQRIVVVDVSTEWWFDVTDHRKAMPPGYYRWFETLLPSLSWRPAASDNQNYAGQLTVALALLDQAGGALSTMTMTGDLQTWAGPPVRWHFDQGNNAVVITGAPAVAQFNGIRAAAHDDQGNYLPAMSAAITILQWHKTAVSDGGIRGTR